MYKILVLIFLIQIMGCSKSNITEKVIDSTMQKEADDGIQFITSTDLGVFGNFDFGSVNQQTTLSKIVSFKNNSTTSGKIQPDLSQLLAKNGIFAINYAASDCITSIGYKLLQQGQTCQIELMVNASSSGYIAVGLPLYDPLNGNILISTLPVSVTIQSPADLITTPIKVCGTNYHKDLISGKCISDYKDCTAAIPQATSASKHWNSTTKTWDACLVNSCAQNYTGANGSTACALTNQTRICSPQPNFSTGGVESTTDGGNTWSACSGFTCSQGYQIANNNTCVVPPVLTNSQVGLRSNGSSITLIGTCEGTLPLQLTESGNTTITANCNNGTYAIPYTVVSGTSGTKIITIKEDKNGVESSVTVNYILDTISPTLSFNSPLSINSINASQYTLSGVCSSEDIGESIAISFTDTSNTSVSSTANCLLPFWTTTVDLSLLQDGNITLNASLSDLAGNSTNISTTIEKSSVSLSYSLPITEYMLIPQNLADFQRLSTNAVTVSASGHLVKTSGQYIYVGTPAGLSVSNDNGATWTTKTTANGLASNTILDLATSGNSIFVATYKGLSISTDNGKTFSINHFPGSRIDSIAASGLNVYVSFTNTIRYSRDGGQTFAVYSGSTFSATESRFVNGSLVRAFGNNVFLIGNNSYSIGLSVSTDNGLSFTHRFAGQNFLDIYSDNGLIYILNSAGQLSYSLDNLTTIAGSLGSLSGSASGSRQIVANGNDIYVTRGLNTYISHNGGGTWETLASLTSSTASGLAWGVGLIGSNVYIYHSNGIYISQNGGYNYQLKSATNSIVSNVIKDMVYFQNKLFILTDAGLAVSTDNGKTYFSQGLGSVGTIYDLEVSPTKLYIATSNGLVSSTDGSSFSINLDSNITSIKFANNKLYSLKANKVHTSTNDGISWTQLSTSTMALSWYSFSVDGANIYGLDYNGYFIYSTDNGLTFNYSLSSNIGATICPIYAKNGKIFIPTSTNGVYVSTNNGQNFSYKTTTHGLGSNVTYSGFYDGTTLYIGTSVGLSISTDQGSSFVSKGKSIGINDWNSGGTSLVNAKSILVNSPYIHIGTSSGVSSSEDNGVSFVSRSTTYNIVPTDIQKIAVKGSNIYVIKNYQLYISTDNGKTFNYSNWLSGNQATFGVMDVKLIDGEIYVAGYATASNTIDVSGLGLFKANQNGISFQRILNLDAYYPTAINDIIKVNNKFYIATSTGLIIHNTLDNSFLLKTTSNGLGSNTVTDVKVSGSYVFAATAGGVAVSIDNGTSFNTKTTAHGLVSNNVKGIEFVNNIIYAATDLGLSISSNFTGSLISLSFTSKTTTDGLVNNSINDIKYYNGNLYLATINGLSITSNGTSFVNKKASDGFSDSLNQTAVNIYGITSSDSNRLYFATNGGIITTTIP